MTDSAAKRVEEYDFIDFNSIFPKETIDEVEKKDEFFEQKIQKNEKPKEKKQKEDKTSLQNMKIDQLFKPIA